MQASLWSGQSVPKPFAIQNFHDQHAARAAQTFSGAKLSRLHTQTTRARLGIHINSIIAHILLPIRELNATRLQTLNLQHGCVLDLKFKEIVERSLISHIRHSAPRWHQGTVSRNVTNVILWSVCQVMGDKSGSWGSVASGNWSSKHTRVCWHNKKNIWLS